MSEFLDELIGKQIVGSFKVNKIMWQSPDNDFKIVSLKADKITEGKTVYEDSHPKFKTMSAKGVLHSIEDGDMLNLVLEREKNQNEKYGKYQFKILSVNADVNLEDINEQKEYLRGVLTETQFENLYTTHENPYDILMNNDREALLKVDGFGHKTIERVMSKVLATKDNAGVYVKLSEFGLTKNAIDKLIKMYEANTQVLIEKIIKNPYFLIEEVD